MKTIKLGKNFTFLYDKYISNQRDIRCIIYYFQYKSIFWYSYKILKIDFDRNNILSIENWRSTISNDRLVFILHFYNEIACNTTSLCMICVWVFVVVYFRIFDDLLIWLQKFEGKINTLYILWIKITEVGKLLPIVFYKLSFALEHKKDVSMEYN